MLQLPVLYADNMPSAYFWQCNELSLSFKMLNDICVEVLWLCVCIVLSGETRYVCGYGCGYGRGHCHLFAVNSKTLR